MNTTMYRTVRADTMETLATDNYYGTAITTAQTLSDELQVPMHIVSNTAIHATYFPTLNVMVTR